MFFIRYGINFYISAIKSSSCWSLVRLIFLRKRYFDFITLSGEIPSIEPMSLFEMLSFIRQAIRISASVSLPNFIFSLLMKSGKTNANFSLKSTQLSSVNILADKSSDILSISFSKLCLLSFRVSSSSLTSEISLFFSKISISISIYHIF